MNASDDKIFSTFWERDPECINQDDGVYGIKVIKPSSVSYVYYSETLYRKNLASLERRIMRDYEEAENIENSVSKTGKIPRRYRSRNPLLKIGYSIQTKLKTMTKEDALDFLRRERQTGREGFFILRSSRNLTLNEALSLYREKDSIEKIMDSLKNAVGAKPLRVWTDNAIYGVIIISFLAQLFISLSKYEVVEVRNKSSKFIIDALEKLTVTVVKGVNGVVRTFYSNFGPLNMALLGLNRVGGG